MRSIRARLERLERRRPPPGRLTFEQAMDRYLRLLAWLDERGYADALAAQEAGESGPEGLQDLLREQAAYDPKRRAWARLEAALNAHQLPDEADVELIVESNGRRVAGKQSGWRQPRATPTA